MLSGGSGRDFAKTANTLTHHRYERFEPENRPSKERRGRKRSVRMPEQPNEKQDCDVSPLIELRVWI